MTLGEHYKQLKIDLDMAELLDERWCISDTIDEIMRDYKETSIAVLEKLLDTHPEIWEIINSLE